MTREDLNPSQVDPWPGQAEGPARRRWDRVGMGKKKKKNTFKKAHKIKGTFLILQSSTLKSTVVEYNSWSFLALSAISLLFFFFKSPLFLSLHSDILGLK